MFVRPEDLQGLAGAGGRPFEELLFDLIVAEGSRHGLPLSAIRWDHRTNIGDGGRDIVVDATHADPSPRFIPNRPSIWSAKSGKDGKQPAVLRRELVDPAHSDLRQHIQAGNPYVWCTLEPMSEDEHTELRNKVREVASAADGFPFNPDLVEFRGLTILTAILNDNPGLIAKHLQQLARTFEGVLSLPEWEAQDRIGFSTPYVDFANRARFVVQIRSHLRARSGPNVLHLAGLSGVGKTRTVLEACRDERDLSGVLYIPRYADFRDPLLRHLTRNANLHALVVIDEVSLVDVKPLVSKLDRVADRIRVVTIGPARRNERGRSSENILIVPEPETREGVLKVVRGAGTGISEPVLESIAQFSAHDLRLALMLVDATRRDGRFRDLPIEDGEDVWRRVVSLFGDRLGDPTAFQTLYPYLTIAIDLGVAGDLRHELERVAEHFAVPVQRLDETVSFAVPCGLGVRSTDFFEPTPRALAGHLFRQRIWGPLQPRLPAFLSELPDRLLRRFVERCQECAGPEREEIESALATFFRDQLGPPAVIRLADRGRSRLFKAWAELDPDRGLDWLKRAVDASSAEQLELFDGQPDGSGGWRGRRQVVWLCESLASFGEHFWTCEAVLFRLAQVETEPSIGNNSTVIWKSMYLPVLAFTEIPFPERSEFLLRRISSCDVDTLGLLLSAVVNALSLTPLRIIPPAIVGGRVVPEPWRPATRDDLQRMQQEFGRRAIEAVGRMEGALLASGRRMVAANVRIFVRFGLVDELRTLLDSAEEEVRHSVHAELRETIALRASRATAGGDETLPQLIRWEEFLRPADLPGRVKELTSLDYWHVMRGERLDAGPSKSSPYSRLVPEILASLGVLLELESWFASDKAISAFSLGLSLGENDRERALDATIGSWLQRRMCRGFVTGYFRGLSLRLGELPADWSQRLEEMSTVDPGYAAIATVEADFSEQGFRRVLQLVESRLQPPRLLAALTSPNWEPLIGVGERLQLLDVLQPKADEDRAESLRTAMSLAASWTKYGSEPLAVELVGAVVNVLRDGLEIRCDTGEWSILLDSVAKISPKDAVELAADALTSHGPMRVVLQDLIFPTMLALAKSDPRDAMDAIGVQILSVDRGPYFRVLSYQGLFDAIGLPELQRWIKEHGPEPVIYFARHLSSPHLKDGVAFVPPVTDWVLSQFGGDDRILGEFCMGRHAFVIREGHARDRRVELEKSIEPFRSHELSWVRRWAEYELRENDREAAWDDVSDDRFERM